MNTTVARIKNFPALVAGLLSCLLLAPASAMEAPLGDTGTSPASGAAPEEITITGRKLFRALERQIMETEDKMYGIFNAMNEDDRYDVHCRWEVPMDSHIRQRVCRPEFLINATTAAAKDFVAVVTGFTSSNPTPVMAEINFHYPVLEEKMREAIKENPELLESVIKSYELRQELAERKSSYLRKD